jgi:hypothetical protein
MDGFGLSGIGVASPSSLPGLQEFPALRRLTAGHLNMELPLTEEAIHGNGTDR